MRSACGLVLGVLQSRSSPPKISPKTSVRVDGLQRWAETGFKGWHLSAGWWKSWLKSGCCERADAAVRTLRLQVRRVNLLPRHSVSSPGGFKTCCSLKLTILLPLAWRSCSSLITGFRDIWESCFAQRACPNSSWCEADGQPRDLHFSLFQEYCAV